MEAVAARRRPDAWLVELVALVLRGLGRREMLRGDESNSEEKGLVREASEKEKKIRKKLGGGLERLVWERKTKTGTGATRTPQAAPPSSSPRPSEHTSTSPISIRPRRGPPAENGSLNLRFGADGWNCSFAATPNARKPVHSDSPATSMSRLSYASVMVKVDLLTELPSSINITLPNGVSKSHTVLYESLPRFCKRCKTLEHSNFACTKTSSHKRKKHPPTTSAPFGCSNHSADTKAIDKQSTREEPQAVVMEERVSHSECKRAKLASQPGCPDASFGFPQVVHVSEDHFNDTAALPPRRQYLTRRKAVATSTFGRSGKSGQPSKSSSPADSRIQGSTASTPSSSL
uniref:Zinc knuckle CX2CX4HX4C domain-containing protein n=1 Tax=Populus alba TaxID=43335 RepID=A0A4U5QEI2_POPAL|nr:hypothetical protein D5086_0000097360 [Populus alba]